MTYDYSANKIVAVLDKDLETWKCLNVIGHLGIGLGARLGDGILGRPVLEDASGLAHRGIARYPLIIKRGRRTDLRRVLRGARGRPEIVVHDYPAEMLETSHDDDLCAALGRAREEDMKYLGILLYGASAVVDGLVGNLSLWK